MICVPGAPLGARRGVVEFDEEFARRYGMSAVCDAETLTKVVGGAGCPRRRWLAAAALIWETAGAPTTRIAVRFRAPVSPHDVLRCAQVVRQSAYEVCNGRGEVVAVGYPQSRRPPMPPTGAAATPSTGNVLARLRGPSAAQQRRTGRCHDCGLCMQRTLAPCSERSGFLA